MCTAKGLIFVTIPHEISTDPFWLNGYHGEYPLSRYNTHTEYINQKQRPTPKRKSL